MKNDTILVFFSRPNPFLQKHKEFIRILQKKLSNYNIKTITLQADNYDLSDSLKYLTGLIRQCYGMIIVGFKQIFIDKGYKKKGGKNNKEFFCPEEILLKDQAITSPFCQIEGTIGIIYDLPILIINENGIREEGIMQGGRFCVKTNNFQLSDIHSFFNDEIVNQQINVWIGRVQEKYLFLNMKKCT